MSLQTNIIQTTQKRIILVSISLLRTALPYFFSMAWPYFVFILLGKDMWGKCVDTLLIIHLTALIIGWGTQKYMLKKFDLFPLKINQSWLENIHTRFLLAIPFYFLFIISPYSLFMKIGILLTLTGKFIYESYEPLIEYKQKYLHAIISEILGFGIGFNLFIYQIDHIDFEWIIFFKGISEIIRGGVLIAIFPEINYRFNLKYFNLNYIIQAYPYFMVGFSNILLYIADRVFVYINFNNIIKAEYQIFMNFLMFIISVPNLLLIPFFKNYYKSRIKITQYLQMNIILWGVILTPIIIYIVSILCRYIYSIDISFNFIVTGMLFIFPTFVYSTYVLKLMSKNKHLNIAIATIIAAAAVALACSYLVKIKGVQGALIGAAMGQWILMGIIVIIDFQNQSEKKIKLIK